MIIALRPPDVAGPLRIGATGQDAVDTLRQLDVPLVLCRATGSRPGWGVRRLSGLFIGVYFNAHDHVEAIEFGRPGDSTADAVTYNKLDVFTTPAANLITHLQQHTTVREEDDGHRFTAPDLLLSFWRPTTPETPDDEDGRYFESVLLARPGYHDQAADEHR